MPDMESLKAQTYNGRGVAKGEVFDVDEKYVKVMVALGHAKLVVAEVAPHHENVLDLPSYLLRGPAGEQGRKRRAR